MPYLVIAYPTLAQQDRQWLRQLREQYDTELASVIAPHFTLVFPLPVPEAEQLISHAKAQAKHQQQIPFVLRCALPVKDMLSETTSIFLVPEEGFSALVKLHDTLYSGVLASALRLDIPFIPHLTIGKTSDPELAKRLADRLNQQSLAIQGKLEALDVIQYEKTMVKTLARIPLMAEND